LVLRLRPERVAGPHETDLLARVDGERRPDAATGEVVLLLRVRRMDGVRALQYGAGLLVEDHEAALQRTAILVVAELRGPARPAGDHHSVEGHRARVDVGALLRGLDRLPQKL